MAKEDNKIGKSKSREELIDEAIAKIEKTRRSCPST